MNRLMIATLAATLILGAGALSAQAQTPTPQMPSMDHHSDSSAGMMGGMMMGNDPVGSCAKTMNSIASDPKLHAQMNKLMTSGMQMSPRATGSQGPVPASAPTSK